MSSHAGQYVGAFGNVSSWRSHQHRGMTKLCRRRNRRNEARVLRVVLSAMRRYNWHDGCGAASLYREVAAFW